MEYIPIAVFQRVHMEISTELSLPLVAVCDAEVAMSFLSVQKVIFHTVVSNYPFLV